ncbi:MAG: protein-disulfide reductase DsbD domain-containing protein [Alphaproteobacteria bacterium]
MSIKKRQHPAHRLVFAGFLVFAGSASVQAETASDWERGEYSSVRLIAASDGVGPDGTVDVGVQMRLRSGWKTYWRSPGQAGVPTRFDMAGSANVETTEVAWPTPERFSDFEFETYGYGGEVVFPIAVDVTNPKMPTNLRVKVTFGVCKEICIPMEAFLELDLKPVDAPEATSHASKIQRFRDKVPLASGEAGLSVSSLILEQDAQLQRLEILAVNEAGFQWPDVALELPPAFRTGVPGVRMSLDRRRARLSLPLWSNGAQDSLVGETVKVTLWDEDGRAVERSLTVEAAESNETAQKAR